MERTEAPGSKAALHLSTFFHIFSDKFAFAKPRNSADYSYYYPENVTFDCPLVVFISIEPYLKSLFVKPDANSVNALSGYLRIGLIGDGRCSFQPWSLVTIRMGHGIMLETNTRAELTNPVNFFAIRAKLTSPTIRRNH